MRKLLVASVIVITGWTVFAMTSGAQDDKKVTIKEVMKIAMKGKLADKVAKGQRLLTLEAMKMEHALTAPFDGIVAELNATAGAQVSEGQLLVKVEPEQPSS